MRYHTGCLYKNRQRGGRALPGAKGINLLMSTLQNRLVDHGYVTTRVLAPSQDLKAVSSGWLLFPVLCDMCV